MTFSHLERRILLTWSFECFISGALIFSFLELRRLLIWSFDIFLSGALNFSYLERRSLSGVLILSYLEL